MKRKARNIFLLTNLAFLCSGCFSIYDIVKKNGGSSTLSSVYTATLYQYEASGNDYVSKSMGEFPYATKDGIAYCSVENALSLVFDHYQKKSSSDTSVTYSISSADGSLSCTMTLDSEKETITFDDYDVFTTIAEGASVIGSIAEIAKTNAKAPYLTENGSSYQKAKETVFDLSAYQMTIDIKNGDFYLPVSVVNHVFVEPLGISIVFNGTAFYLASSDALKRANTTKTLSSYGEEYYGGRYYQRGRSSTYSNANYNDLCFLVDSFYGFSSQFKGLDSYLGNVAQLVQSYLQSNSESLYDRGIDYLLNDEMGDGHTGSYGFTSTFGDGTYTVSSASYSSRMVALSSTAKTLAAERKGHLGSNPSPLRYSGDTAILSFDEFVSTYHDYTRTDIAADVSNDTFALFYEAFKNIDAKGSFKNVIIDLSLNGGGAVAGLIGALGFLTNDVHVKIYDPLTESKNDLCYNVDTNLDGVVNSSDVKNYNFYVLVSNYSFSCANLFASICQEYNLAKIIGMTSGGGACIVRASTTADGLPFQMSGPAQLCRTKTDGSWENIDSGVTPDITLNVTDFYDDAALAAAIA